MIARVWRGVVAADRLADYVAYVDATGVAEYRRAEGCRVSMILTRQLEPDSHTGELGAQDSTPRAEVIAFSVWDDEAAVAAFTGPDINAMVLYPEDEAFLLEPPTLVHHDVEGLHLRPDPCGSLGLTAH